MQHCDLFWLNFHCSFSHHGQLDTFPMAINVTQCTQKFPYFQCCTTIAEVVEAGWHFCSLSLFSSHPETEREGTEKEKNRKTETSVNERESVWTCWVSERKVCYGEKMELIPDQHTAPTTANNTLRNKRCTYTFCVRCSGTFKGSVPLNLLKQ